MANVRKRKLPSGNICWLAAWTDSGGERRFKSFEKKRDAESYLARTVVDLSEGKHVAPSQSITFADAAEIWIRRAEQDGLRASTIEQYRSHVHKHLVPRIGTVKLTDITKPRVAQLIAELKDDLSVAMVRKIKTSLTSILGYAQELGRVGQNVALGVKVTRRAVVKKKVQPGVDFPTRDQVSAILACAEGAQRPLVAAAIFTGMRSSELRGLQWSDVDLEVCTVTVRRMADHLRTLHPPKSDAGSRVIPIGDFLTNTLRVWKDECPASDLDLVFPGKDGRVAVYSTMYRSVLKPVLVKCGLVASDDKDILEKLEAQGWEVLSRHEKRKIKPAFGMHAFRHFYASWRLEQRYNVKQVQTWLGHENATMTLDLYGHLLSTEIDQDRVTREEIELAGPVPQHVYNKSSAKPLILKTLQQA